MLRAYRLSDFTTREIKIAKQFVKAGILGFVEASIDEQVHQMFDKLQDRTFTDDDVLQFVFEFNCSGNTFVAAVGAARNSLK